METVKFNTHRIYQELSIDENNIPPTLFFAGRISQEKGILDFPEIFRKVKKEIPGIRIIIAGSGPEEYTMRRKFPEATYLGWIEKEQIKLLYSILDLFIFPSRFDTFGNVVLEAFGHGMPVIAYNLKGPKDIIEHEVNGFLVKDKHEMAKKIIHYFTNCDKQRFKDNAIKRSQSSCFQADAILDSFLKDIKLI